VFKLYMLLKFHDRNDLKEKKILRGMTELLLLL